jgi:uncharacterized glyoxalase superfamily protein PhnB
VEDCTAAIHYYCEILGFQKDFDDVILGREEPLFAGISRDECEITLNQHDRQEARLTVGCEVEDVDLLHEEYHARGVKIVLPPKNEVWGKRHMAVEDLDGHQLHFSSPIRSE